MPVLERPAASIHYQVYGSGFPLILFAPGGMNSVASMWRERPGLPGEPMPWIDPSTALADDFMVIEMDQRNAGASTAEITASDGWRTYTDDHLALLDHLDVERAHVMGGCIGSSYCLSICQVAPDRVTAAVLQNPIGLSADNRAAFMAMVDGWGNALRQNRPELTEEILASVAHNMFGGDFVFSVDRDFVRNCPIPFLVLAGGDEFHPKAVAEEISDLAPSARLVLEWAGRHAETAELIRNFLLANTPAA